MYKHLVELVQGINWLGIIPLVLFFAIFIFATISILRKKQDHIDKMASLPFDDQIENHDSEISHK